jgi:DNA-directed RNA polymerase-5 subunit 1
MGSTMLVIRRPSVHKKVPVPFTESTLFTRMKCMRRLQRHAIQIRWDAWSLHVRGASMQYLALDHFLRFYDENQLKSNKGYGDSLYAVLALVRTDQEKARYTFLEDVQQPRRLPEQNGIAENRRAE